MKTGITAVVIFIGTFLFYIVMISGCFDTVNAVERHYNAENMPEMAIVGIDSMIQYGRTGDTICISVEDDNRCFWIDDRKLWHPIEREE